MGHARNFAWLAASPKRTHMRTTDPVGGSDLPEAAILEDVPGNSLRWTPAENITRSRPGFPWDFERLYHAATKFQI
jgi:hypothetical protein